MAEPRTSISPTAHYTGAVWQRRGLSHPALSTAAGRAMYWSLWPAMQASRALGGHALEEFLFARHLLIDRQLERAIEAGGVTQVIEIAAGMSPRGWRFAKRYGDRITYIETDLPEMAASKSAALREAGLLGPRHRVEVLDALAADGQRSLSALAAGLDTSGGVAIVTEGLLTYLEHEAVLDLWRRCAEAIAAFPSGLMLSDLHLGSENKGVTMAVGARLLSVFVRGNVEMHFEDRAGAIAALEDAGFPRAALHRGSEVSDSRGAPKIWVAEGGSA
jgi:O-methyltransferase involved in polyketide biosynthesis